MTTINEPLVSVLTRDIRQQQIIPPEVLERCDAMVIGVGAIGRQVALQLAAVGLPSISLFDHDIVGIENLAPQAYNEADVGTEKVIATRDACFQLNSGISVYPYPAKFVRSSVKEFPTNPKRRIVVFCCVDSIAVRKLIWESVRSHAAFFVDGRMSAEVIRVLATGSPATCDYYETTLFAQEEAYVGACTARSTVYTGSIAAGLMLSAFTRWLRGMEVERDMSLNLLASELNIT